MKAILVIVCLSGGLFVQGQFVESFGIKTGLSLANQYYVFTPIDYELPNDLLVSPGVFFFMEALKGELLSLQLDLGYVVKGNKTTAQSVTINHLDNNNIVVNEGPLITSKYHYLSVSPMARYRQELKHMVIYALLGPRIDYLLIYSTDSDYPLEEQNEFILGLTGGFGIEYKFANMNAFAEIQYQPDLSPVTNKEPLLVNNNCLFVSLGVRR